MLQADNEIGEKRKEVLLSLVLVLVFTGLTLEEGVVQLGFGFGFHN